MLILGYVIVGGEKRIRCRLNIGRRGELRMEGGMEIESCFRCVEK